MDFAIDLIRLGAVGLIAGLFSSALANKDYRHRKWWELRVAAYQNAIEALSDLVFYYEKHLNAEMESRELSEEYSKKLDNYWEQAYPKIRKFADSGAFLFSDKANAALREFIDGDEHQSYFEYLDDNLVKAKKCLSLLIECSKVDLKLK